MQPSVLARRSTYGLVGLIAFGVLPGCVTVPDPVSKPKEYDAAIGSVTMTAPQFIAMSDPANDDDKLDFGNFKSVDYLWSAVSAANLGSSSINISENGFSAKVNVAGPQVNDTSTAATDAAGKVTRTSSNTTTLKTPDAPTPDAVPASADTRSALLALLTANSLKPQLTPEQIATLVSTYRGYMLNLEKFNNPPAAVTSIASADSHGESYYPYRVNFLISANPGWYALQNDYLAELTMTFTDDTQVVSVMPAETAQVVDDFNATLQSLAISLSASGSGGLFGGSAKLDHLQELAERLQGLRTNTNLVVGFPADHKVCVQFRPSLTAERRNLRDLQPNTRLMTAIVLRRTRFPATNDASKSAVDADKSKTKKLNLDSLSYAVPMQKSSVKLGPDHTKVETYTPLTTTAAITYSAKFVPGPSDRGLAGGFVDRLTGRRVVYPTNSATASQAEPATVTLSSVVPAWKPADPKPITINKLVGSYQRSGKSNVAAIGYSLILGQPIKKLTVHIGGIDSATDFTHGSIESDGVLTVPLPDNDADPYDISLPVTFVIEYDKEDLTDSEKSTTSRTASAMGVVTLNGPPVPAGKPSPAVNVSSGGVTATDLPFDANSLDLLKTVIGKKNEVRLVTTRPAQ